jgi:hypothetical protein
VNRSGVVSARQPRVFAQQDNSGREGVAMGSGLPLADELAVVYARTIDGLTGLP